MINPAKIFPLASIFYLAFAACPLASADEPKEKVLLEPIVITPTRIPLPISQSGRSISVIDSRDIETSPAHSVEELLDSALGVDMKSRGPYGIQADVTIRGSTYAQALVLVNGIRVNDPQTGHYNLDTGITLESIERIEVLRGHGSSLYGPDAFGGVINIITKTPQKREGVARLSLGEHDTILSTLGFSEQFGDVTSNLSWERKESDGYRDDTDFDINTISSLSSWEFSDLGSLDLVFGYSDKEFGASDFYAAYPSREWTDTIFTSISAHLEDEITLEPKIYYRKHKDKYVLDIARPTWYVNYHTTHTYGTQVQSHIPWGEGYLVLGGEVEGEEINSTNIGKHNITRGAVYTENEIALGKRFSTNLGNRIDYYSNFGGEWSPSLTGKYDLTKESKLRLSVGRSFRAPSFTELYYQTATNIGSSDLTPEAAWSYEAGIDYTPGKSFSSRTTLFFRDQDDVIDWLAEDGSRGGTSANPWRVQNVGEVEVLGIENALELKLKESTKISLNYTFMDSDSEPPKGKISKYALTHTRHHLQAGLNLDLGFGMQTLKATYKKRIKDKGFFVLDTRLSKNFGQGELFIEITNLLDRDYEEIEDIPMPGRWVHGGMAWRF